MSHFTSSMLKVDADEILQRLEADGEPVDIERNGRVVARLVPVIGVSPAQQGNDPSVARPEATPLAAEDQARLEAMWAKREQLIASIKAKWPAGVSAVDAVREGRRDL
ncbi:MAG: type II toxin-antitoxin system Phd/YefM family antitoxin [Thermomicrobiales bacterium]